jgi:hypothetical protein
LHALTKTWISFGLVILALFEFWTAMSVFGDKKERAKNPRLLLNLHRAAGYVFAVYFVWISWVCVDLMEKLYAAGNYALDARNFWHSTLAITLFIVLVLKVAFIRRYRNYRPYVPLLGIILAAGTVLLWGISGWMYLIITSAKRAVL